jgi:hypothetical protein
MEWASINILVSSILSQYKNTGGTLMTSTKSILWLAGGLAAIWLALGCSNLPYSNNTRPVEPPPAAEQPPVPANR